jgi:hypothetical protein
MAWRKSLSLELIEPSTTSGSGPGSTLMDPEPKFSTDT